MSTTSFSSHQRSIAEYSNKCWEDWNRGNNLCVASAGETCIVSFNGEECQACTYVPPGECSRGTILDGYTIDCSKVDKRYGIGTRLCGTEIFLPESSIIEDPQYSPFYNTLGGGGSGYHGGNRNHHYSGQHYHSQHYKSSSSSSNPIGAAVFTMVTIVAFILQLARCCSGMNNTDERQRLQRYRRVHQGDDPLTRALELTPVAVALEAIPDEHFDFEFLHGLPDDTTASKLKEAIEKNDWESIRDILSSLTKDGSPNNEERSFYFGVICEQVRKTWPEERTEEKESYCPFLDAWKEAEPNSSDCRILRAQVGTSWAWHARSAALADMVTDDQWNLFFGRLKAASAELKEARRLSATDPLVYSTAVPIAKGLRGNEADMLQVTTCLDELRGGAKEPLLFRFHTAALEYYCAKWHGNHQQMFSYARSITSSLPAGHPLWCLIPMAHYERNLIEQQPGYWRQAGVVSEIRHAYQNAFPGASETSSPATTSTNKYLEWTSRNYFAFAFALTMSGVVEEARRQIRVIGRRPTERPWWDIRRYKAFANTLGFDVQPAVPVAEDAPAVVARIV